MNHGKTYLIDIDGEMWTVIFDRFEDNSIYHLGCISDEYIQREHGTLCRINEIDSINPTDPLVFPVKLSELKYGDKFTLINRNSKDVFMLINDAFKATKNKYSYVLIKEEEGYGGSLYTLFSRNDDTDVIKVE